MFNKFPMMERKGFLIYLVGFWMLLRLAHTTLTDQREVEAALATEVVNAVLGRSNANKILRPKDGQNSTEVKFGLTLQNLALKNNDLREPIFIFGTWVNMEWKDYRLAWDPQRQRIETIRFPSDKLWLPDIQLYNSLDPTPEMQWSSHPVVYSDGTVSAVSPNYFPVHCPSMQTSLTSPQLWNCILKFGSWTYNGDMLNLTISGDGADISTFADHRWTIVQNSVQRNVLKYACCDEQYIDVTYNITISIA